MKCTDTRQFQGHRRPLSLFLLSPARQHSRTQRSWASFSISQLYLLASIIKRNTSPAHQSGIVAFNAWAKQRIIRQKCVRIAVRISTVDNKLLLRIEHSLFPF
ncbi:hypothetical protein IAS59_002407 [Cryptococcus gattii]